MDTDIYSLTSKQAQDMNESKDCSVRAVSIACNIPYPDSHTTFHMFGRKPCKGTPRTVTDAVLDFLADIGDIQYWKPLQVPDGLTVRSIATDPQFNKGRYIVIISRHMLAMIDGVVHDWTANKLHRVKEIYKVVI